MESRQNLARFLEGHPFHRGIMGLAFLNAFIFGLESFAGLAETYKTLFRFLDVSILMIFVAELFLKLYVFGWQRFFHKGWNIFDFIIIGVSIIFPVGPWASLRILRILRIFVLFEFMPKMKLIIKAIHHSLHGILHTLLFGFILFYVWSLLGYGLFHEKSPDRFGHIGTSMWTLFKVVTLEGWEGDVATKILSVYPAAWGFFVAFIIMMALVVLNLCVGVIVDALSSASQEEKAPEDDLLVKEIRKLQSQMQNLQSTLQGSPQDKLQLLPKAKSGKRSPAKTSTPAGRGKAPKTAFSKKKIT